MGKWIRADYHRILNTDNVLQIYVTERNQRFCVVAEVKEDEIVSLTEEMSYEDAIESLENIFEIVIGNKV